MKKWSHQTSPRKIPRNIPNQGLTELYNKSYKTLKRKNEEEPKRQKTSHLHGSAELRL
jgi:hypothetical protein